MNDLCGNSYSIKNIGDVYCDRTKGHTGFHKAEGGTFAWQRKEDKALDERRRKAKSSAIQFVRQLAEDKRTLPWFETAREIVQKMDEEPK